MGKNAKLTTESVYSKVEDKNFGKNINNSPVWNDCYTADDLPVNFKGFVYKVAFDGTKPVQVMKMKKV